MDGTMVNADKAAFSEGKTLAPFALKKKKKKSQKEQEQVKGQSKQRLCHIDVNEEDNNTPKIIGKSTFLCVFLSSGELKGKVHFLKRAITEEKCQGLAHLLRKNDAFWTVKKDHLQLPTNLGNTRHYFTAGMHCAIGHTQPGRDKLYWAKPVGNIAEFFDQELIGCLMEFARIASVFLQTYRPDIYKPLAGICSQIFNPFNIFFAVEGVVKQHTDRNDALSVIFPIQMPENAKGGLEIGGTSIIFSSKPGDIILLDSNLLSHGVPEYEGELSERIIGIFVIQKSYLQMNGVQVQ